MSSIDVIVALLGGATVLTIVGLLYFGSRAPTETGFPVRPEFRETLADEFRARGYELMVVEVHRREDGKWLWRMLLANPGGDPNACELALPGEEDPYSVPPGQMARSAVNSLSSRSNDKRRVRGRPRGAKVGGAGVDEEKSLSPEENFTHLVLDRAKEREGVTQVKAAEDFSLHVWIEDQEHHQVLFLGNIFKETRELDPEAKHAAVDRFLGSVVTRVEDLAPAWEEVQERLVPVIRPDLMGLYTPGLEALRIPLLPCLSAYVVVDFAERMMYVTDKHLADWKRSAADVFEAAEASFLAADHAIEPYGEESEAIWHVANADAYDSSRLLLAGLRLALEHKYGPLAYAIPDRESMLFAPLADTDALARLHEIAEREYAASPRPLSPVLYVSTEEHAVTPLVLDRGHPLAASLSNARAQFAMREHQSQKQLLEKRFEEEGVDVYVSAVDGIKDDDGSVCTYGIWAENVDTLLGHTDLVVISVGQPGNFTHFRVTWSDLQEVAGVALERTDEFGLPRWRTQRWLAAEELEELRQRGLADQAL